jgi:FKBP-type peptidyl-prolyl cis-trans isomerase FkpA
VRIVSSLVLVTALAAIVGCGEETPTDSTGGQLILEDLTVGTGAAAVTGDTVTVNYTGSFLDGRVFDSGTFPFRLGTNAVIPGFEQAVIGMRVGGRRRATIPPHLAYGSQGRGAIPPNATLRFEIELVSITR